MDGFDKYKYRFSIFNTIRLADTKVVLERGNQSIKMIEELSLYNIIIKDLINECPSINIRNQILNIAYYIVGDLEFYEETINEKKLPINKLTKKIAIEKSFFELWQEYIIVYVVILGNPNYKYIQEYLKIEENVSIIEVQELIPDKLETVTKGIVISKSRKKITVLTSKGEFKKIEIEGSVDIGEEVSGELVKSFKTYKLHIAIISILIITMISVIVIKYLTIAETIVINTTSSIKLEINCFNKVVNAQSQTDRGIEMLDKIQIQDEGKDDSIYKILEYALKNEMIPNDNILITVSGKVINFEELVRTNKFLEDNDISVKLNNFGNEHYIN
ncbi:MAG: anti-sigma factor domain-containing protein [Terrisporobacter sp.]